MSILDSILWTLGRPQQAVFQGADAGARAFADAQANILPRHALQEEQTSQGGSNLERFLLAMKQQGRTLGNAAASIPEFIKGAFGDPDRTMRGGDLTEGMSDTPWVDKAAGYALDATADPLQAVWPVSSQAAGTIARTGGNMARMAWNKAPQMEQLKNYGLLDAIRKLDIPVASTAAENTPMVVRTPTGQVAQTAFRLNGVMPESQTILGRSLGGRTAPTVLTNTDTAATTLPHEYVHWSVNNAPMEDFIRTPLYEGLQEMTAAYPREAERLHQMSSYAGKNDITIGNELLARSMPVQDQFQNANLLREIVNQARLAVPGEAMTMANPMNLTGWGPASSLARHVGDTTNSLWDAFDWSVNQMGNLDQYIKDYGQRFQDMG